MNTPTTKSAEQEAREVFNRIFKNVSPWTEKEGLAELTAILAERGELLKGRELHTMQLAAISTASISNTELTWKECHNCHDDYKSAAFFDVLKAVRREMDKGAKLNSLKSVADGFEKAHSALRLKWEASLGIKLVESKALTAYNQWRKENE